MLTVVSPAGTKNYLYQERNQVSLKSIIFDTVQK